MKKILIRLMEYGLKGVDIYTYYGSVWLIFTDTKEWVLELTPEKTLWYNYTFFKRLFCVATSDITIKQKFITEWVEDNIVNETKRTNGRGKVFNRRKKVESVIENGVKVTSSLQSREYTGDIDEVLQKGVEETNWANHADPDRIDEVIEGGIKEIYEVDWDVPNDVIDEVIDTGITSTHDDIYHHRGRVDGVIKNGVKETTALDPSYSVKFIEEILENGIKETKPMDDWVNTVRIITEVIDNGIKKPTD